MDGKDSGCRFKNSLGWLVLLEAVQSIVRPTDSSALGLSSDKGWDEPKAHEII